MEIGEILERSLAFSIDEPSQVGAARRSVTGMAAALGLSEARQGELALMVTELGNNLVRHAAQGELFLRVLDPESEADSSVGIELIAVDKGPGMTSVSQCLQDGYSTAGTSGTGMGAIARLAQTLEIYTVSGEGTVLLAQFRDSTRPVPTPTPSMDYGVISRPKPGQDICGDSWGVEHLPEKSLYFVADGLGHGPDAARASREAVYAFRKHKERSLTEILEGVHSAIAKTRGVAAAIAEVDPAAGLVRFAGIGNIAGSILSGAQNQNMVSHNGILGHQVRKIQEFTYGWAADSLLLLHSDGLSSRGQLERYPGLIVRHPGLIAGVLYRDFKRDHDDATVLIATRPRSRTETSV